MARNRSPNRDKAFEIYKKHYGNITAKEIAAIICEKERNITEWKSKDKWKERYNPEGGAPIGNQNAIGNNGGAPSGNQNARTDGWYSKHYPTESKNIIKELQDANASPLEILWAQIATQWAVIVRAQKIMYVKDQDDLTKELKKLKVQNDSVGPKGSKEIIETYREEEYELQFSWDKQANFMNAQSRAMTTLANLLKRYDDMLHANWDTVTEEQKLRVDRLKIQIKNPEFQHRKLQDNKKLDLEKERFEHTKEMDEMKGW